MSNKAQSRHDNAIHFDAMVRAGARADTIEVCSGALRITVKAKPEHGLANQAALRLVAKKFGVNIAQVKIVRGLRNKRKRIRIRREGGRIADEER